MAGRLFSYSNNGADHFENEHEHEGLVDSICAASKFRGSSLPKFWIPALDKLHFWPFMLPRHP
jgi:hypothetical protein